jgi:hypothetical protein
MQREEREMDAYKWSLMRHALGMDSKTPGFRNHFAADPGSDDDLAWMVLAGEGLAVVIRDPGDLFPLRFYAVTKEGKAAVGLDEALVGE